MVTMRTLFILQSQLEQEGKESWSFLKEETSKERTSQQNKGW
jgi:hypothetical protein